MKGKTIVTIVLLGFVALSVVYLVIKETRPPAGAAEASNAPAVSAAPDLATLPADAKLDPSAAPTPAAVNSADDTPAPKHQVLAYYFHTNTRCPSCIKIEKYSTKAITEGFADELESGALVFNVVNTDEKGNEHYVKDYDIVTKSLILVDRHQGKETRWVNLEAVWDLLGDEEKFIAYVQENISAYLNEKE